MFQRDGKGIVCAWGLRVAPVLLGQVHRLKPGSATSFVAMLLYRGCPVGLRFCADLIHDAILEIISLQSLGRPLQVWSGMLDPHINARRAVAKATSRSFGPLIRFHTFFKLY